MRDTIYSNGFFKVTTNGTNYHVRIDNIDESQIVDFDSIKKKFLNDEKEYDKRGFVAAYLDKSKAIKYADKRKSFYLSTWAEIEERNS